MVSRHGHWAFSNLRADPRGITIWRHHDRGAFFGYNRLTAARFSLLLSLPAISGAGLLKTIDLIQAGDTNLGLDAATVVVLSALFAWLAIRVMMSWLARANFTIFVVYRLGLGILLLLGLQLGLIATT